MANLLDGHDWDYVVGSVHFLGDDAVDCDERATTSGLRARIAPTTSGSATSRRSPRRRAPACSTSSPTRTSSRSGAARARRRTATCAATTSRRSRRSPRRGVGDRGLDRRAAQAGRRDLPGAGVPGDGGRRGHARSRCPATRTCPTHLGFGYEEAVELLDDLGVHRARRLRAAASAGWSRSDDRTGIGATRTASRRGGALILGGVEIAHDRGPGRPLRRRRPDPRGDRRAARRGRDWATSASTSPTPTPRSRAPTRSSCCARPSRASAADGWRVEHVDATVMLERPKLAPHRDGDRDALAGALRSAPTACNVKATTGEGMGFVGREEGVAALAVATLSTV